MTNEQNIPDMQEEITAKLIQAISVLRNELGCAVIVWTPEELGEIDPSIVEDRSIEFGTDLIAFLQNLVATGKMEQ